MTNQEPVNETAMTVDPVITWLEQIRDFIGSTPQSKAMAQRTIDRLRPPAVDPWTVVGALVSDLGDLRAGDGGALVSDRDRAAHPASSPSDVGYYGGYLIAESITRRNAVAMSFLPQLLVAARECPGGRAILQRVAAALSAPAPVRTQVTDRLDGTLRLSRLANEFKYAGKGLNVEDPFYVVALVLERLAAGLLDDEIDPAVADVEAFLERTRRVVERQQPDGAAS